MTRRSRAFAALFSLLALVFAQVAVSAHSCASHRAAAVVEVMAHHADCGGGVPEEAPAGDNVCFEHCQYGKASFDNGQPPPAVGLGGAFLRIVPADAASPAAVRPAWRFIPAAAPPPPAILFGVLRI